MILQVDCGCAVQEIQNTQAARAGHLGSEGALLCRSRKIVDVVYSSNRTCCGISAYKLCVLAILALKVHHFAWARSVWMWCVSCNRAAWLTEFLVTELKISTYKQRVLAVLARKVRHFAQLGSAWWVAWNWACFKHKACEVCMLAILALKVPPFCTRRKCAMKCV